MRNIKGSGSAVASWIGAGALAVLSVFAIVQNARAELALRQPASVGAPAGDRARAGATALAMPRPEERGSRSAAPLVILIGLSVAVGALVSRRPRTWDRVGPEL